MLDLGEFTQGDADNANIPVNIWLDPMEPTMVEELTEAYDEGRNGNIFVEYLAAVPRGTQLYQLRAAAFMPRRERCASSAEAFWLIGTLSEVQTVLRSWLELYTGAVSTIENMIEEGSGSLYYW